MSKMSGFAPSAEGTKFDVTPSTANAAVKCTCYFHVSNRVRLKPFPSEKNRSTDLHVPPHRAGVRTLQIFVNQGDLHHGSGVYEVFRLWCYVTYSRDTIFLLSRGLWASGRHGDFELCNRHGQTILSGRNRPLTPSIDLWPTRSKSQYFVVGSCKCWCTVHFHTSNRAIANSEIQLMGVPKKYLLYRPSWG